jgi:hypothetical protein
MFFVTGHQVGIEQTLFFHSFIQTTTFCAKFVLQKFVYTDPRQTKANGTELKRINHQQNDRWQHLFRLKAGAFFYVSKKLVVKKWNNLYWGKVWVGDGDLSYRCHTGHNFQLIKCFITLTNQLYD